MNIENLPGLICIMWDPMDKSDWLNFPRTVGFIADRSTVFQ